MTRPRSSLIYLVAVCLILAAVFDLSGVEVLDKLSVLCLIVAGLAAIVVVLFDVIDVINNNSRDTTPEDLNDIAQQMEDSRGTKESNK